MKLSEAMGLANQCSARLGAPFRVFLASGFNPQHLTTFLTAFLARRLPDRRIVVDTGLFGDLAGSLERFGPAQADALAVIIEWDDLDPRLGHRSAIGWRLEHLEHSLPTVTARLDRLVGAIHRVSELVPTSVVLPTLTVPLASQAPLAWSDSRSLMRQQRICEFAQEVIALPGIRVLNSDRLDQLSPHGQRRDLNHELRFGFPYTVGHASILSELLAELIAPAQAKKAIITDLDNTLWRGVLGENGLEGISWDLDRGSQFHALYQRMLASLADIGVLLGVATKNDPALAGQALGRQDLIVPAKNLFPVVANWGPKSEMVACILRTWNIGADAVVFVDDSPMEIAEVTAAWPGIHGVLFPPPGDHAALALLEMLRDLFGKVTVTEEDRLRVPSLRSTGERSAAIAATSAEDFLAQADAEITIVCNKPDQRALDLINKTNQFNLNGRRIGESAWRARLADSRFFLLAVRYQDRFGPLGTIAVVSGRYDGSEPLIDTWVMSCRAFSRRVEHHVLRALFERFDSAAVRFEFVLTDRNGPFREFIDLYSAGNGELPRRIERTAFFLRCPPLCAKVDIA